MNKTAFIKNVVFGFAGQMIVIILGIVIPRVLITSYGSDVNGLISTVSQVFTYMALLEAGVGQAARNALYGPLARDDKEGVSRVASTARRYYRHLTLYYAAGVLILTICLSFVLKSNVDKTTIALVVLFEGMAGVVSFYFIETQTMILAADGRGYINNAVTVIDKTLGYAAKIVLAFLGVNIAIFQFVYFLITVAKVFFYNLYFRRAYPWLDYSKYEQGDKLKDRNSYIVTEVAWTVFSSTDSIVLSTLLSTQLASVYMVYNMVFSNLSVLLNAVYISISYVLGQTYNSDKDRYKSIHDVYNSIFFGGMTILMSISYILILPFVSLYTSGVSDVNYIYPSLPLLFCLVQLLSWGRYVSGNLVGIAGYIRDSLVVNIAEALINIVLTVLLSLRFGIVGVLAGTVCALPIKLIYCNYMADRVILKRPMLQTIKILGGNLIFFLGVVLINSVCRPVINGFLDFLLWGLILCIIIGFAGVVFNIALNPSCGTYVKRMLKIGNMK